MAEQALVVLEELKEKTFSIIKELKKFKEIDLTELNSKLNTTSWSVLECIDHLRICSDIYLKNISVAIAIGKPKQSLVFRSGLLGGYAAKSMLPKGEIVPMKMKTFKFMEPEQSSELNMVVLDQFTIQMERFLDLLNEAEDIDLTRTRCKLAIKGLRFRLGDALRFFTNHNLRHIHQANKVLTALKKL